MIQKTPLGYLINYYKSKIPFKEKNTIEYFRFRLSEFVNNPYLRQRQIDLTLFNQNDEQQPKMSSQYIPLLPKDLLHIPLRPIDDDSLGNVNKRSRSKGRFPFHLPSFLNKRKFFFNKSSSTTPPPQPQTFKDREGNHFHLFSFEKKNLIFSRK